MKETLNRRSALKLALAAAAMPLSAMCQQASRRAPSGSARARAALERRAAEFRKQVMDLAMGPGGMIIAFVDFGTRRPFQEGVPLHGYLVRNLERVWGKASPRPTTAEWYYGENTLWATGWFLYSQILRYRATREPEALETARKCFRDLNNLFRLSREIEPGLLGKPHGGRAGPTTSFDQSASPVIFYVMYAREFATAEEKAEATQNMALHGDYYIRRNWVMNHHGNLQKVVGPGHTSTMKYLACVYAAYQLTGDSKFRDEAFKHLRQLIQSGRLPWPSNPYETNHNLFYYSLLCDFWKDSEITAEFDWKDCIRQYWQAQLSCLGADGLPRLGNYDHETGAFTPYPSVWSPAERAWQSATLHGNRALNCAFAAALAIIARGYGLDERAPQIAERILLRMNEQTLRWWWGADEKFPEEMRPVLNIFAPEVAAVWLVAYWMGRLQKFW